MTNALPACEGVFIRPHCPHSRLFEDEYKRCFPHCCPHHVDRSYCGSSLDVVLRFDSGSDISEAVTQETQNSQVPFDVSNVFVFSRFETVDNPQPFANTFSLRYLRSISQSEVNPEASWIEGVRQTAADTQQHSQQLHGRQSTPPPVSSTTPSDAATFVLNGQAFAKWYYHWESGANKVQRATKHALKAYVFYQTHVAQSDSITTTNGHVTESSVVHRRESGEDGGLKLLCIVTSPPFTVVSYRRAPLEACTALTASPGAVGMDTGASLMPHYATDTAHPVDSGLRRLVQSQISRAFQEYNQQRQYDSRRSPDKPFTSRCGSDSSESQTERSPYERYRRLQQREGLRFRLLTPEGAARSGSSLAGQMQPKESRLVFDRTRRRTEHHQHWRNTDTTNEEEFVEDYDDDDDDDEAVPQPVTAQGYQLQGASSYELKASRPVDISSPQRDSIRPATNAALLQFKQQQQQTYKQRREVQQLTDLAIIHFFVSRVTTKSARSLADLEVVFTIAISQHWRFASGGATHLARLLLAVAAGSRTQKARQTASLHEKRDELMLVLGEICIWAFSPTNVELMQSLLTVCYPLLLEHQKRNESGGYDDDRVEFRTAFMECVSRCWNELNVFLQSPRATQTAIRSVREMSDAVLGIVYSDPEFKELRTGLREMLQRPSIVLEDSKENSSVGSKTHDPFTTRCNFVGWRGFVAQVREGYLRGQYSSPWSLGSAQLRQWTGDWLLQPSSVSTTAHKDSQRDQARSELTMPSLWTSCLTLSQLLHLKLAASGDPLHTLYVQAVPSVLVQTSAWLRLICDGRVRVAPITPNGLTSLMGGSSYGFGGDYVAYRLESHSSKGVDNSKHRTSNNYPIRVEFYWWPLSYSDLQTRLIAFRSVVTLKTTTTGAFLEVQMELERGLMERDVATAAGTPELELWTPTERIHAVRTWHSWLSVEGVYARK